MNRALLLVLGLSSYLAGEAVGRADEGARLEAKTIAGHGDERFYAGRCDEAIPLWRRAAALYRAPTLALRVAHCQALLGQVVAAAATLDALLAEAPRPEAPVFAAAREDAQRELARVRARIAELRVVVSPRGGGPVPVAFTVEIDGAPAPPAAAVIPIDPGTHRVRVRAGRASWESEVHLADAEVRTLDVPLWVEPLPAVSPAQRTGGLVTFGAGSAALAAGIGLSVAALSTSRALDAVCGPDRMQCPPSAQGAVDRLHAYSLAADGTLVGGAALVVAGAVLLTVDLRFGRESSRVRLVGAPGGVAVAGGL
jgi:hypothetical protein